MLDDGKVAGMGTHRELLKNCEVYREIAASQLSEAELKAGMEEPQADISGKEVPVHA